MRQSLTGEIVIHGQRFPLRCLAMGATLYHGTAAAVPFREIRAPAWFTADRVGAALWAGWRNGSDPARERVLRFRLSCDLWLIDTPTRDEFLRLNRAITGGKAYHGRYTLAAMLRDGCLPGWVGNQEIMLTRTEAVHWIGDEPCSF